MRPEVFQQRSHAVIVDVNRQVANSVASAQRDLPDATLSPRVVLGYFDWVYRGRNIGTRAEILTDLQNRFEWLGYTSVQPPPIPPRFSGISDGAASSSEADTPGALWFCGSQANTMTCEGIDAFAEEDNTNFCLYEVSSRPWKYTNCRRRLSTISNRCISYLPRSRWTCNAETNEMECRATAWTAEADGCDEPSLFEPDYQPFCVPSTATADSSMLVANTWTGDECGVGGAECSLDLAMLQPAGDTLAGEASVPGDVVLDPPPTGPSSGNPTPRGTTGNQWLVNFTFAAPLLANECPLATPATQIAALSVDGGSCTRCPMNSSSPVEGAIDSLSLSLSPLRLRHGPHRDARCGFDERRGTW